MLKKRQASFRMSKTRQDKDVINDTQGLDTFARFSRAPRSPRTGRTGDTDSVGESDETPMPARAASPQFLRDAREDQHSISKRHFETLKQKQEALPGAFLCVRMQRSRVAEGFRLYT